MFLKDVFRLIKSTSKRFISLSAIVFIGVAFMFGLLANTDIMKESVGELTLKTKLQDFQIYSNFGFDDNDVRQLRKIDIVDKIYASKTRDVFAVVKNRDPSVFRVRELNSNINKFELLKGRLPEKENECLIINNGNTFAKIGDTIKIYLEDEDIFESIKNDEYIVTGICASPEYMSKMLSTSLLNNLELESVIYVPNSNFIGEYYTSLSFTIVDSNNFNPYDRTYYDFIDNNKDTIENFVKYEEPVLKATIVRDAEIEIEDAKKELAEGKEEGEKELKDALKKLNDVKIEIVDGENEIIENEEKIEEGQEQIDKGYQDLKNNENTINNAISQIEQASGGQNFNDLYLMTLQAYENYNNLNSLNSVIEQITSQTLIDLSSEINITDIDGLIANTNTTSSEYAILLSIKQLMNSLSLSSISFSILNNIKTNNDNNILSINNAYVSSGGIESTYNNLNQLKVGKDEIANGYTLLASKQKELDEGKQELENGKAELDDAKKKYKDGIKEYNEALEDFNKEIEDAQKEIDDAIKELNDLDDPKWILLDRNKHYSTTMYKNSCEQMNAICVVMPIIFFLVAALVCSTTMKRLIDEQRGQIGIYCALGYSKASIVSRYLLYVLFASIFSSIFGLFIGIEMFPTVIYNTWRLLYYLPSIKMVVPIDKLIICVFAFTILMCVVSYFVISKSLKETPSSLLRPKPPKNSKAILLERIKIIWNNLSFISKVTARNLFRYKSRFLMTVLGIAGCTGLLVLGFGIKDSISDVVNIQYNQIFTHNYVINLDSDKKLKEIDNSLLNNKNVNSFASYMSYTAKTINSAKHESTINVYVLNKDSYDKLFNLKDKYSNNQLTLDSDGVIITEKFSINEGIKVGDYITISSKDDIEKEVKVVAISKMYFQHYLFMSEKYYNDLFNEDITYTNYGVNCLTYDDNDLLNLVNEDYDIASINDFSSFIDNFNLMIEALDLIIIVIIVTSGALALVVLINLINVNISERIREIATLKVLGFRNNEVNSYIFKEIFILSIIGSILGMPLGVFELKFVMNIINMDMIMFPTQVKFPSFAYSFVITMLFTIIVLFNTRKPLKNVKMVESLKSIE